MAQPQEPTTFQHPSIGSIRGIRRLSTVDQFRGIRYAELADRFARGTLVQSYRTPVEATTQGPLPVADPNNCDAEHLLLQHPLPHPDYSFSDTECLTLNVSTPVGTPTKRESPLPVLVFIHGGGFVTGSASWPQWDLAPLVELSVKAGTPILAVGINYRLGHFGFLTSPALREAGYRPNNGIDDQKLGLRWVQKYIAGFGGDPDNVTFFGSSIGAASGFTHLQSEEKLFHRLVALAGSPLIQPLPLAVADFVGGVVAKTLGLGSLAPNEQVQALLEIPASDLEANLRGIPLPINSVLDGDIVRCTTTFDSLSQPQKLESMFPGIRWVKTILMGECQFDGMVFAVTALAGRKDDLAAALKGALDTTFKDDPVTLSSVLSLYGLDNIQALSDVERRLVALQFSSDVGFSLGTVATARAWAEAGPLHGTTSFLSHFHTPNPWPGEWTGYGTHVLDATFALQNYNSFLSGGQRACAERIGRDIISFVCGREPFPSLSADGMEMFYNADIDGKEDKSKPITTAEASQQGRRTKLEGLAAGNPALLDKLLGALGIVLKGP